MGTLCRGLALTLLLTILSGCFAEDPKQMAVDFIQHRNYELLSDEDKKYFTKEEFSKFRWAEKVGIFPASSKYFPVEVHLKKMVTYQTVNIENKADQTLVTVEKKYPAALDEVIWFTMPPDEGVVMREEELDNLLSAYNNGVLAADNLQFSTETEVITILDSGVYIDLKKERERHDKFKKIEAIKASVEDYLADYKRIDDLSMTWLNKEERFTEILEISENLDKAITAVKNAKAEIIKLSPEAFTSRIDWYLRAATHLKSSADSYRILRDNITFHDVTIGETRRGGPGIFGSLKYTGEVVIDYGSGIALFKDSQGVVIGKQILTGLFKDLQPNEEKGFGYKVEDYHLAKSATTVEVQVQSVYQDR